MIVILFSRRKVPANTVIQTNNAIKFTELIDVGLNKLLSDSVDAVDKGVSLPFYEPYFDADGVACAYTAKSVWSGAHIDFPLYGDLMPKRVEHLITGGKRGANKLDENFMSFTPAFRVALLVHHICQMVVINPMAAEAYVIGRYEELGLDDSHFKEYGVPSTEYMRLVYTSDLNVEWVAQSPTAYMGKHLPEPRINGWALRVRGAHPKRDSFYNAWDSLMDILDEPSETGFTINNKKMQHLSASAPKKRKRSGNPDVELMCTFVDELFESKKFPTRKSLNDWQAAQELLVKKYPYLFGRWSSDSMRRSYKNHKKQEGAS